MMKIHATVPIAALALFAFCFARWNEKYEEQLRARHAESVAAAIASARLEEVARLAAIEDLNRKVGEENRRREAERAQLESERLMRQQRQSIHEELGAELRALSSQEMLLRRDIALEETLVDSLEKERGSLESERDFLVGYVQLAEKNAADMVALVEEIIAKLEFIRKRAEELAAGDPGKQGTG
jgi:hypothetical protein